MSLNSSRSAGSNSKRSRNSNSSSVNSDVKRRKNNPKTIGTAWGAQSHSSSRSSFRQAPFSDFGSYMAVKNQKLHEQFDAEASSSSLSGSNAARPIFQGVSIFVDGFTIPSSQELKTYMLKHGGRFENYFSKKRVTHIICSNLPQSKIKNIRSFSGGLPVVKPTWVRDSVAANKLLSWIPYQLDQHAETSDQPKLSDFFMRKSKGTIKDADDSTSYTSNSAAGSAGDKMYKENSQEMDGSSDAIRFPLREADDSWNGGMDATSTDGASKDVSQLRIGKSCSEDAVHSTVNAELQSSTHQPSTSANSHYLIDSVKKSSSPLAGGPCHGHSTIDDPCFVQNYFKSSRLHFIGTWRNRYRKRYLSLSRNSKDINASSTIRRGTIIHVDMDCFFVAVAIRNQTDLQDKPVAVCHSDNPKGTAEISSANYPARGFGIRAGMFVRDAKALCPHLVIVPYDFEAYEEVADRIYEIFHKYCTKVQAVSCDEAFLEVTNSEENDPELLASTIRKEIFEATGCTASAGISHNILLARLATRSAKPDGQCYISPDKVDEYLLQLPIKALPGIGRVMEEKLKKRQVQTCGQLRMISKECLQKDFGLKTGEMLWNYSRGIDNRPVGVIQENKSIGADVNWGVRFRDAKDFHHFIASLCKEVSLRLQGSGVLGRSFTLKIKKRRKDAGEPTKYMGCGDCENLSHSTLVPIAIDDVTVLQRIALQLFGQFHVDFEDIRGVGLQVGKLESSDHSDQGIDRMSLRSWLASAAKHSNVQNEYQSSAEAKNLEGKVVGFAASDSSCHEASNKVAALPSINDLDFNVIESLPPDLISEINDMYGGLLTNLINKKKSKTEDCSSPLHSNTLEEVAKGTRCREEEASASYGDEIRILQEKDLLELPNDEKVLHSAAAMTSLRVFERHDAMPSSISQVDVSVLEQLPEELRVDIVTELSAHRNADESAESRSYGEPKEPNSLFDGCPPCWVARFKSSNCFILNAFADMYFKCGTSGLLSCILRSCMSQPQALSELSENETEEATKNLCELFKEYMKLKLETDMEEIYVCCRLLKRLSSKSKALQHIYTEVLCYLQAASTAAYGGTLQLC